MKNGFDHSAKDNFHILYTVCDGEGMDDVKVEAGDARHARQSVAAHGDYVAFARPMAAFKKCSLS